MSHAKKKTSLKCTKLPLTKCPDGEFQYLIRNFVYKKDCYKFEKVVELQS